MDYKFGWKDDDLLWATDESGMKVAEVRISEIPIRNWWDENDDLHLVAGETAGRISRDEVPKALADYFSGRGEYDDYKTRDSIDNFNLDKLWTSICFEHWTAWMDFGDFFDGIDADEEEDKDDVPLL